MKTIVVIALALISVSVAADQIKSFTVMGVGIGSHTTRLSVAGDNGQPQLISVGPGIHSMPGPVYSAWTSEGFLLTPDGTNENLYVHPFNTIFNLKYPLAYSLTYSSARPSIAGYQVWTMQELTTKYLRKLQISGESIIGRKVYQLSIVEPPNLDPNSDMRNRYEAIRQATSGVHRDMAWPELTRKSYMSYYPFDLQDDETTAVLVYHLGGSTFGVSVTLWDYGAPEYLSSIHDENFGGQDFNQRLVDHLVLVHEKRTSRDLSRDNKFMMQLGREVEKAKQLLSSQNAVRVEINVSSSSSPAFGNQPIFSELLTRSQFEDLNKDLFEKTIAAVDRVLLEANMTKEAIQDIVLSGGSARIPFIQKVLKKYFGGGERRKEFFGWDQPEITALFGAARHGHWLINTDPGICCSGFRPLSVGIETAGGVMFRLADDEPDGFFHRLVDFSTATDNQDRVVIRVFEGRRALTKENTFLGQLEFLRIAPAPRGVPQIRVRMQAGYCGNIIHLTVIDLATRQTVIKSFSPRSAYNTDEHDSKVKQTDPFKHMDTAIWKFAEIVGTKTLLDPA